MNMLIGVMCVGKHTFPGEAHSNPGENHLAVL